jgi:integral membrane sensor domain MASE1
LDILVRSKVDKMAGQADDIMPVDKPPKICEVPAKVVPLEVLPPLLAQPTPTAPHADGQPIHALSALILVAVDSLWIPGEFLMPVWVIAIPACFAAVFIPTYLIQKHLKNDSKGRALTFATILAVLAAIPTPITGTPVGLGLLAWTGLGKLFHRSPPR